MKRPLFLVMLFVGLLAPAGTQPVRADDSSTREYQIKAALIFKFAQFTQWPETAFTSDDEPLIVATVGPDPFGGSLEAVIAGKTIGSRPIVVQHFADAEHMGRCHVLFVAREVVDQTPKMVRNLSQAPVMLMADTDGFCEMGGILQFYIEDQKVHFEVNTNAAARRGLKLSSQLLKLAKVYKKS